MSLLKLPVDLLQDLFDCEELHSKDFKNLRLTNPALNDVTCGKLFQTFTLDLDNPYCMELVIGKQPEPPKAANCENNDLEKMKTSGGQVIVEDCDDDVGEENEKQGEEGSNEEQKDKKEEKEEDKKEELPEFTPNQVVDFEILGRHVRDLKIKGMGNKYPEWRAKLLDVGFEPLISKMPNLRSISANFTDRALINAEWAKLLLSICPPDSMLEGSNRQDNQEEQQGEEPKQKPWILNLSIDRRMDNVGDDEIYRNLGLVRNVTDLSVATSMRFGKEAREERIEAGITNLAKAINNCPNLKSLTASFGYYCDFEFDNLLSRIEGDHPLPIEKLNIDHIEGPALLENVRRLINVKDFHLNEPARQTRFDFIAEDVEEELLPSVHDNCCSKGEGEKGACMWMQMASCGVLLSKVKIHDMCQGFVAYLRNPSLVGNLTQIELRGVAGTSKQASDEMAQSFWSALVAHADHIRRLDIDADYYGGYCWEPNNTAAEVVKQMVKLEHLTMCPATDPTYIPPGPERKRSSSRGNHFVGDFIEALWAHPNLKTLWLSFSVPNGERGAWCGTSSVSHLGMMRSLLFKHVGDAKGETKPGFVVKMQGDWYRRRAASGGPVENVWKPEQDSTDGVWRFVNEHEQV